MNSVTITLTRLDYALGLWRSSSRHPVNVGAFVVFILYVFVARLTGGAPVTAGNILWVVLATVIVGAIVFGVLIALTVLAMSLLVRRNQGLLGEHTFEIVERGLLESTNVNEHLMKWGGVRSLQRTRRYIYIRVVHGMHHTIPRRYFADVVADEEFWKALQPLVAKKNS